MRESALSEEPARGELSERITRWLPWVLLAVAVALLLIGAWVRRHSIDDAFINYRIVQQIEAGNGPVFNAHERVEAFTSPLWLLLLLIGDLVLPLPLEWIGMAGTIVLAAVGFIFAGLGSSLLQRRSGDQRSPVLLIPLGALLVAVFPPVFRTVATGLEEGLTLTWLGACAWVLGRWARSESRLGLPGAVLLGLGVLVRPDLAPYCATFLIVVLIGDRDEPLTRRGLMLAAAAALPVLSELFRMGYYGVLTPNTAITKSASLSRWDTGWSYFANSVGPYWFWVPVIVVVLLGYVPLLRAGRHGSGRDHRSALVAAAFVVGALICALYIIRMGGGYMPARLLLSSIFGFFVPVFFIRWPSLKTRVGIGVGVAALVWAVVVGTTVRTTADNTTFFLEPKNAVTLSDFPNDQSIDLARRVRPGQVYYGTDELPYHSAHGRTPVLIEFGIGKPAFALPTDAYVLDGLGLANPLAAHMELRERGWPGHEKILPTAWLAALSTRPGSDVKASDFPRPESFTVGGFDIVFHPLDDPRGRPFPQRVATTRGVLLCREMVDFRASYQAPLTVGRFWSNLRGAPGRQGFSIPGEPSDAAGKLCSTAEQRRIAEVSAQHD